ncbi:Nucleoid-associated protein SPHI_04080 [Sphingomonas antarctica]|uniref:YbaB/EbfC family nucleoid-associated protein n=1 Tax=Sphingomonas antarctica TaxID=2040274 RepID=UPI0039ED4C92
MNLDDIMKMASNVQQQMTDLQAGLDDVEVEGASGGGLVKIKASAKGRIIGVSIDNSLMQPSEKTMLEDLVAAAINDARAKADNVAADKMSEVTRGMSLPPGFTLPG